MFTGMVEYDTRKVWFLMNIIMGINGGYNLENYIEPTV